MAGQFTRFRSGPGWYRNEFWYTQKRPYKKRLPYVLADARIYEDLLAPKRPASALQLLASSDIDQAVSRCYDRFKSKLGDASQIGAGIGEWKSTAQSINKNAVQLLYLASAVRRGNVQDISRALREMGANRGQLQRAKKTAKSTAADAMSSRWLEYSFGWAPLVQDVYNAIDVLQRDLPNKRISGRASFQRTERFSIRREQYVIPRRVNVQMIAEVSVVNPNLYVANQLGLINPASIAWELVPFSFVVDWFTNAGQVLGAMSDFAGLEIQNPATTIYGITDTTYAWVEPDGSVYDYYTGKVVEVERRASIVGPSLIIRPFSGFSVTRGANAISLLIQQLVK